MSYTKLDSSITDSTIWQAPDTTRIVWITMLAMADQNGYIGGSVPGLAGRARVSLDACVAALECLTEPDKWSRTKEHEGRRIAVADGGWVLLNHAKYRATQNADDRRERSRVAMADLRASRKQLTPVRKQLASVNHGVNELTKLTQAEAEAETEARSQDKPASAGSCSSVDKQPAEAGEKSKGLPDCPHLDALALWRECLPALPQHLPEQWRGARADHLRARWRETAEQKGWTEREQGLAYLRKLFGYVGRSEFLTGKAQSTTPGKRPFVVELEWLVNPTNWAKVLEGKYHEEQAA